MILGLILPENHPWREQATALGTVAFDGEVHGLVAASRAHIDVLLVDASDLEPQDLDQLRAYRISRPQTRIVVALAEDVQPGSPHLAALVGMGIYDLAKGPLSEALSHTPTYADAARWTLPESEATGPTRRVQVRERIVERRIAGSQRPVLVVIAGVGYGVGTTTLANAVAHAAREQGQPVTLIDAAIMPGASRLDTPATALRAAPRGGHLPIFEIETTLRGQTGGYVVVDAGRVGESAGLPELALTADTMLLAVAPAPHRLAWAEALAEDPLVPTPTAYVVVGGSEAQAAATAAELRKVLHGKAAPVHHLSPERSAASVADILGERLMPSGQGLSPLARLRWKVRTVAAVPGGALRLLRTLGQQVALVVGRLLGLVIVAGALALVAAVVMPVFGGVHAVAHLVGWAHAEWRQFTDAFP